jgi:hypothetical protein
MKPMRVLVGLAVLAIGACASGTDEPAPTCPEVVLLGGAEQVVRFAPGRGRDVTDIDYEAEITDVVSRCEFVDEGKTGNSTVVVAVAPVITAARGSANESQTGRLEYFVGVLDPRNEILNKQVFAIDLPFPGNRTRVVVRDDDPPITIRALVRRGTGEALPKIVLGMQLTSEELDYNRRRGGLPR